MMPELDASVKLINLFTANRHRHWYFVRPGGNWGDHLIYYGAESLARSLGLRWRDLDYKNIASERLSPGACIYLHGGGGFNPWGSKRAFSVLRAALRVPGSLVVQGPQSCDTESDATIVLLSDAFKETAAYEVHFFAREVNSAHFLTRTLPSSVAVHLDHDTAFHLPQHELLLLSGLKDIPIGRYALHVARQDDEAPVAPLESCHRGVKLDPAYYARSFGHWLRIHAFASQIISNRLHSAIVGSLLGKPTELLAGTYHKNRSIWEFNLRERGVVWRDQLEYSSSKKSAFDWVPELVARSWKVRTAYMWMRGVPFK